MILLFPGVWHRYRPVAEVGWDEYWVSYNGPYVERLVRHGFFSPEDPLLKTGVDDLLLHAYVTLLDRLRSEPVGLPQFLAASVMEILAATQGAVRAQGTGSRMHELVCRAKSLLEARMGAIPTIEKLAAAPRAEHDAFLPRLPRAHGPLALSIPFATPHRTGQTDAPRDLDECQRDCRRRGLREPVSLLQRLQTEDRHVAQPVAAAGTLNEGGVIGAALTIQSGGLLGGNLDPLAAFRAFQHRVADALRPQGGRAWSDGTPGPPSRLARKSAKPLMNVCS